MCGLTLSLRLLSIEEEGSEAPPDPLFDSLIASNARRGPDSCQTFRQVITTDDGSRIELVLAASVLGLRGDGVTVQPLVGRQGVLGWNGQVFAGMNMAQGENDTKRVYQRLEDGEKPWEVLSEVEGPSVSSAAAKNPELMIQICFHLLGRKWHLHLERRC